jgi:hypothetical protein
MKHLLIVPVFLVLLSCSKKTDETAQTVAPETENFDIAHSDPAAIELVDTMMTAAGGEQEWQKVRFIKWSDGGRNFFWDKTAQNVRIESPAENSISIINLATVDGRLKVNNEEIKDTDDSLKVRIGREYQKWLSSAAKIFLPFTLKHPDISLKYLGEEDVAGIGTCNVLEIQAGEGKRNYKAFASLSDNLIRQLQIVTETDSVLRSFEYGEYKNYDKLKVSIPKPSEIQNLEINGTLDENLFTQL